MDRRAHRHPIALPLARFYDLTETGARLYVRASPGAKQNAIGGLWRGPGEETRLSVKVTAAPDKGKANAAILALLAKALGLPKSALLVASGDLSRLKTIDIRAEKAALAAALNALAGEET